MNIKGIRSFISCLLVLSLLLIIPACQNNSEYSVIEEVNRYLASEDLGGRREGSDGNIKARDFIANKFEEIGLDYLYGQSYLIPYELEIADFDNLIIEFSINQINTGEEKKFEYGIDFLPRGYLNGTIINCPVTSDTSDPGISSKALLVKSAEEIPQPDINPKTWIALVLRVKEISRSCCLICPAERNWLKISGNLPKAVALRPEFQIWYRIT